MRDAVGASAQIKAPGEEATNSAFHIIVLGCGGGPDEDNVSGLLVRSVAARWTKHSILAVDAGVHLAGIIRIFEKHMASAIRLQTDSQASSAFAAFSPVLPERTSVRTVDQRASKTRSSRIQASDETPASPAPIVDAGTKIVMTTGPFKNLLLPCETAKANASLLLRNLISSYLITHPHLDHVSGFAINTAAFHNTSRPKKIAALPWCIDAIKNHIFNDVIWPNLSDEEGGVGFVSYTRLAEGGNIALGDGEGRGYIEICEGLEVKGLAVSHGSCMKKHHHGSNSQDGRGLFPSDRRVSRHSLPLSPRLRQSSVAYSDSTNRAADEACTVDSSAYFIRCAETGQEVLIFGDVEPDSVSLHPRNARVWADAAPKIAAGSLKAIFIECSYDDSQSDETLYGHLTPRHLVNEMCALAKAVSFHKVSTAGIDGSESELIRKRKRTSDGLEADWRRGRAPSRGSKSRLSNSISPSSPFHLNGDTTNLKHRSLSRTRRRPSPQVTHAQDVIFDRPLAGLKIFVIHIKESLLDSTPRSETVLSQLKAYEKTKRLGVEYVIPTTGGSFYI